MTETPVRYSVIRYQLPAVLWALIIFVSSSIPSRNLPKFAFLIPDEAFHFVIYFVFCALTDRAIKFQAHIKFLSRNHLLLSLCLTVVYGLIDEAHQYFVPGRDANLIDLLTDFLGAATYVGIAWVRVRMKRVAA